MKDTHYALTIIEHWQRVSYRNKRLRLEYGQLIKDKFYLKARERHIEEFGKKYASKISEQGEMSTRNMSTFHRRLLMEVSDAIEKHCTYDKTLFCPKQDKCILEKMGICRMVQKKRLGHGDVVVIAGESSYMSPCNIVCIMGWNCLSKCTVACPIGISNQLPHPFPTLPGEHTDEYYSGSTFTHKPYSHQDLETYLGIRILPEMLVALTLIGTPSDNALGFLVGKLRFFEDKAAVLQSWTMCSGTNMHSTIMPALWKDARKRDPSTFGFSTLYDVHGTDTISYAFSMYSLRPTLAMGLLHPRLIRYGTERILKASADESCIWRIRLKLATESTCSRVGPGDLNSLARNYDMSSYEITYLVEVLIEASFPAVIIGLVLQMTGSNRNMS